MWSAVASHLIQIQAEQAASSPPDRREPLWQRAVEVTGRFIEQHPQNPRLLLVQLQSALTLLDRGELARQEAELLGGDILVSSEEGVGSTFTLELPLKQPGSDA